MVSLMALASGSPVGMLLLVLLSLAGVASGSAAEDLIPRSRGLQQEQAGDAGNVFIVRDTGRGGVTAIPGDQRDGAALQVSELQETPSTSEAMEFGTGDNIWGAYFMFSTPPSITTGGLTVNIVAQLTSGTRPQDWRVQIRRKAGEQASSWLHLGTLSDVESGGWTTIKMSTEEPVVDFLDAPRNNRIQLRMYDSRRSSQEVLLVDLVEVFGTSTVQPTPAPVTPAPVTPAPVPPTGSPDLTRWEAFADLVPDWEAWEADLANSVCDPMEECRTSAVCCDDDNIAVCGNGVCEETETREDCNADCSHRLSVCGNGICESSAGDDSYHANMYENVYNCPVDCTPDAISPNLDVYGEMGSCFMRGEDCDPVCGDGTCNGDDTCETCSRDCGACPPVDGDGICTYPFETIGGSDCDGSDITSYVTVDGEDYATIDNTDFDDGSYSDGSCSTVPTAMPSGWRLADWDPAVAKSIVAEQGGKFDTWCLVFSNGLGANSDDGETCGAYTTPIVVSGGLYSVPDDYCAARLMIQRIKEPAEEDKKTCPTCTNGGVCNPLTGACACLGAFTGPTCGRAIGDFSVPPPAGDWYKPQIGATWEWQLTSVDPADGFHDVEIYDIDISSTQEAIEALKDAGKKVMCYVSAGTYEAYREDAVLFPEEVKGKTVSFGEGDEFDDENWLDLRRLDLIAPIMLARLDVMAAKGCDAVEWDNADLQEQSTDLPISLSVQMAYNRWLAGQTHARGMGVAMKNNNLAASFHVADYDMVVVEECWIFGYCRNYWSWLKAEKPVLNAEYFTARCMYCEQANKMNLSTIKKIPDLDSCRVDCKDLDISNAPCENAATGDFSQPIDWTIGGNDPMMSTNWCPMTLNEREDECPADRFSLCLGSSGY